MNDAFHLDLFALGVGQRFFDLLVRFVGLGPTAGRAFPPFGQQRCELLVVGRDLEELEDQLAASGEPFEVLC